MAKGIKLLIIILVSILFSGFHNLKMAHFKIFNEANNYQIEIKLDKDDLYTALQSEHKAITEDNTITYIKQHFQMKFDGQEAHFTKWQQEQNTLYIILTASLSDLPKGFQKIEVHNSCLVQSINGHNNILALKILGKDRMFRMHKGRQQTVINY